MSHYRSGTRRPGRPKKDATEPQRGEESAEPSSTGGTSTASLDIGACCLCHCSLDFSDRAAFFHEDRHEDYKQQGKDDESADDSSSFFFRPQDPYLPTALYDPCNALVYCDSCDRMFHQKCHFVPVLLLPRGAWHCLLCHTQSKAKASEGRRNNKRKRCSTDNSNLLFRSPPNSSLAAAEAAWEDSTARVKAIAWKQQLAKLRQYCQTQLASHRQATNALDTLMSTRRNRIHYITAMQSHNGTAKLPQELLQILVKQISSKWKIREAMLNLEAIRLSSATPWKTLQAFCSDLQRTVNGSQNEFIQRVLFPFGSHLLQKRRLEPRTSEMREHNHDRPLHLLSAHAANQSANKDTQIDPKIPSEVTVIERRLQSAGKCLAVQSLPTNAETTGPLIHPQRSHAPLPIAKSGNREDDTGSGISLDDLQCCLCLQSHASDGNDMILCDGIGCYRSYHQDCIVPRANVDEEEDDWFCPICVGIAELLVLIQGEFMGDEWEQRRFMLALDHEPASSDSLKSWDGVDEVFPESSWEFETVCLLRNGIRNADTRCLLAMVLGEEAANEMHDASSEKRHEEEEDDTDDEEEDYNPDGAENDDIGGLGESEDDDADNSQVSLEDLSSVDLHIGQDEVNALSETDEASEDSNFNKASQRRSLRLRKRGVITENSSATTSYDQGKLDTANIVSSKRVRKPVDYVKLNDSMFGDASDAAVESLDDSADYKAPKQAARSLDPDGSGDCEDSSVGESTASSGTDGSPRPSMPAAKKRKASPSALRRERNTPSLESTRKSKRARCQSSRMNEHV